MRSFVHSGAGGLKLLLAHPFNDRSQFRGACRLGQAGGGAIRIGQRWPRDTHRWKSPRLREDWSRRFVKDFAEMKYACPGSLCDRREREFVRLVGGDVLAGIAHIRENSTSPPLPSWSPMARGGARARGELDEIRYAPRFRPNSSRSSIWICWISNNRLYCRRSR